MRSKFEHVSEGNCLPFLAGYQRDSDSSQALGDDHIQFGDD